MLEKWKMYLFCFVLKLSFILVDMWITGTFLLEILCWCLECSTWLCVVCYEGNEDIRPIFQWWWSYTDVWCAFWHHYFKHCPIIRECMTFFHQDSVISSAFFEYSKYNPNSNCSALKWNAWTSHSLPIWITVLTALPAVMWSTQSEEWCVGPLKNVPVNIAICVGLSWIFNAEAECANGSLFNL